MKFFISLVFYLISYLTFSQKLVFDIFLFGNKIGQTVVEKTVVNDSMTHFTLASKSEAHILFTHRIITLNYDIFYKRDRLFASTSKHTRNDEVHYTSINWMGNKYVMKLDGILSDINAWVDCSTVKLFFAEPCNAHFIFSERLGEFRNIKKTGDGLYEAEMKEGITYYYHYKNGTLTELEMKKGLLGSIYMRPHQN